MPAQTPPSNQEQAQGLGGAELANLHLDALESQAAAPTPLEATNSLSTQNAPIAVAQTELASLNQVSGESTAVPSVPERLEYGHAKRAETARTIAPQPGATSAPAWSENEIRARDILRQMQLQFSPAGRQAVIQLQPAELGRIAFRLTVRGGKIDTEVRVERDATLKDLEHALPELRAVLEREGMAGGNLSLSLGFDQPGGGAFQADSKSGDDGRARPPTPAQSTPIRAPTPVPRALAAALAAGLSIDTLA